MQFIYRFIMIVIGLRHYIVWVCVSVCGSHKLVANSSYKHMVPCIAFIFGTNVAPTPPLENVGK